MVIFPNPMTSFRVDPASPSVGLAPMLLEVLALCGYGLWLLLGLALALGLYSPGRGAALVPLALGCVFVSAGLLAACLRLRSSPQWHGWRIGRMHWPTGEALLALAAYMPMLGLAGLVRGEGDFWATRIISVVLALCSLGCLITSAYGYRTRRLADQAGVAAQLPISRVLSACYGGGLWLWVCLVFQVDMPMDPEDTWPWAISLLLLAMLLGLVDGVAWHSLRGSALGQSRQRPQQGLQWRRFLAAGLICAVPCLSLLLIPVLPAGRWLAPFAAAAYIVGKSLELWLYDFALTRFAPGPP
ncbi:hypothetical protein GCM10007898_19960 [Dyella flagellata]|uniref:DMSO reductase anchor subunit n=2 Tax=Dyella flagellata TaxID=1867833 RepID=A0ABQ5XBV7_9GAMM|nr:hypothetical protein GCM10007898_19960 [Dyella flagellata]